METKGGGINNYRDSSSDEMRLFQGGLRTVAPGQMNLEYGRDIVDNHHEVMEYHRGTILHSRAEFCRNYDNHFLYGGVRKFFFQRYIYQNLYKRVLRGVWIPGMRQYDNKAYDYFYFSD